VDGPCLRPVLVHRQHDAAVLQLRVDGNGGGGQKDGHRSLDPVLVRHQPPRRRVLARGGDGQLPLALQQLQGIGGPLRPRLLGDGQHLVPQVRLAHVKQRLPRHGRVLDLLLRRHEGQHRFQQGRLARRRRGLDQHRQRLIQLAGHRGQVPDQLVRLLPHHPAPFEVPQDPPQQVRRAQQRQCLRPLLRRQLDRRFFRRQRPPDLLVLQFLQFQQHPPQVGLHHVLPQAQLHRRLLDEGRPALGRVEIEGVHVEALPPARQHVHLQQLIAHVFRKTPHPPAAVAPDDDDLVAVDTGCGLGVGGWRTQERFRLLLRP